MEGRPGGEGVSPGMDLGLIHMGNDKNEYNLQGRECKWHRADDPTR